MDEQTIVIISRDVDAFLIPSGARIYLPSGTEVRIAQELGDSFTLNVYGNLVRIDGKDADAIGREIQIKKLELTEDMDVNDLVWSQLKTCYDPEIPVNIVDLGLIYDCKVTPIDEQQNQVIIKMTLTAPGCGMGPVIAGDVKRKILAIPSVVNAEVEVVFDPPWDRNMMSDAAKLQLGMF